jgi:hypothetical protein
MSEGKRVDEDWKRRAQAEKELDALKVGGAPAAAAPPGQPGAAATAAPRAEVKPHPLFRGLIESLASQALLYMGAMRDPMTGQSHQDLPQAQTMIEMLGMIEEKTKGNLAKDEADMLKEVLDEVRLHYVRITQPPPPNPKGPMMGNKK